MVRNIFDHETNPPTYMGWWWAGSAPFNIWRANSRFQAFTVDVFLFFDKSIQRGLMTDPGEPFAIWDSGASH
eukprot:2314560-Prorocentrum_lima.AAC.1